MKESIYILHIYFYNFDEYEISENVIGTTHKDSWYIMKV